jgi:ketosteroid isomerase-like protein
MVKHSRRRVRVVRARWGAIIKACDFDTYAASMRVRAHALSNRAAHHHPFLGRQDLLQEALMALWSVWQRHSDKPLAELQAMGHTAMVRSIQRQQRRTFRRGRNPGDPDGMWRHATRRGRGKWLGPVLVEGLARDELHAAASDFEAIDEQMDVERAIGRVVLDMMRGRRCGINESERNSETKQPTNVEALMSDRVDDLGLMPDAGVVSGGNVGEEAPATVESAPVTSKPKTEKKPKVSKPKAPKAPKVDEPKADDGEQKVDADTPAAAVVEQPAASPKVKSKSVERRAKKPAAKPKAVTKKNDSKVVHYTTEAPAGCYALGTFVKFLGSDPKARGTGASQVKRGAIGSVVGYRPSRIGKGGATFVRFTEGTVLLSAKVIEKTAPPAAVAEKKKKAAKVK